MTKKYVSSKIQIKPHAHFFKKLLKKKKKKTKAISSTDHVRITDLDLVLIAYVKLDIICRVTICNPSPEELGYETNTINL